MNRTLLPALALLATATWASAQPPTLTSANNLGMARGSTREVTVAGTGLAGVNAILTDAAGVTVTVKSANDKALSLTMTATAEGPIGLFSIRAVSPQGLTNARPFCIDALPELDEAKDHATLDKAQALPGKCVVSGTATAESADMFRISLKPNEKLSVEVLSRRLGSPLDPAIFVYDAKTKRELPALYADDTLGLQGDCRTTLQFPEAMEIILEVRDMSYKGGADFAYRLRLGDFPGATTAFPLVVTQGATATKVGFAGPGLQGVKAVSLSAKDMVPCLWISPTRGTSTPGWPVPVKVVAYPTMVEMEPNDTPETANTLTVPGGVSAGFGQKGDKDHFKFEAKKGTAYIIEATAAEHGAPTEVLLTLLDATGKTISTSDPQKPVARLEYTAAADGPLTVRTEHTNYLSGPTEVYFLSVRPVTPDFEITLASDRVDVPSGGRGAIIVAGVTRTGAFTGPITIAMKDSEPVIIPANATFPYAVPVTLKSGFTLTALEATAGINGKTVTKRATIPDVVKATFGTLAVPPADWASKVALLVVDRKYVIATSDTALTLAAGASVKWKVTRTGSLDEELALTLAGLPTGVTVKPAMLAAGKAEVEVELTAKADATAANTRPTLKATNKTQVSTVAVAPPLMVTAAVKKK